MNKFEQIAAMCLQGILSNSAAAWVNQDNLAQTAIDFARKLNEQLPDTRRRVEIEAYEWRGRCGYFSHYDNKNGRPVAIIELDDGMPVVVAVGLFNFTDEVKE